MPGFPLAAFTRSSGRVALDTESRSDPMQPDSEPGQGQNRRFWFPHRILSDNSRVHHSELSSIKPTQAEFPKLHPLPGNCRVVRGLHLAYNSISIRTRLSAPSHLVEQKENYTLRWPGHPSVGQYTGLRPGPQVSSFSATWIWECSQPQRAEQSEAARTKLSYPSYRPRPSQRSDARVTCKHKEL